MNRIEVNLDEVQAALGIISPGTVIFTVNLLRYNDRADYGDRADIAPCSGREAYYERYAPMAFKIIRNLGGRPFWFGHIHVAMFAPLGESWDDVLLVEYPSFDLTPKVASDPVYQANQFHRIAALADTRSYVATGGTEIS